MNKYKLLTLVIYVMTISGCAATLYDEPTQYDPKKVEEYISSMDRRFGTLGFYGLHLGMTYDDVNAVIANTPWFYLSASVYTKDDPQFKEFNVLYGAGNIGCEGSDGRGDCYKVQSASIRFFDGKLVMIAINSPPYTADYIDLKVKEWGAFALKGLVNKYGNPSNTYLTINDVNILSFRSGYFTSLYEWNFDQEAIQLGIEESESKFSSVVQFSNLEGLAKISEEKSKGVTNF
ncbi:MAG: hypothetical protein IPM20_02730 [Gammaproteobacteria bacterium]|nr:hypothetical protein [Gammaproteobacteria bacterium]